MKELDNIFVACDDGRVKKLGQGFTTYACVSFNDKLEPLDVDIGLIKIDGLEASSLITYSSLKVSRGEQFVLLLDSLTIAGFNVVSPATVFNLTHSPTLVVYSYEPSYARLERAFKRLPFKDLRAKVLRIVDRAKRVTTPKGDVWILAWKISLEEALRIIIKLQRHSRVPEPIRVAHNIASEASLFLGKRLET
jgi:endonuclease V-like protein UPF0215 family